MSCVCAARLQARLCRYYRLQHCGTASGAVVKASPRHRVVSKKSASAQQRAFGHIAPVRRVVVGARRRTASFQRPDVKRDRESIPAVRDRQPRRVTESLSRMEPAVFQRYPAG